MKKIKKNSEYVKIGGLGPRISIEAPRAKIRVLRYVIRTRKRSQSSKLP